MGGGGGGGGGVGVEWTSIFQHWVAQTGEALFFMPPATHWQAASNWREGVGELRAHNLS